MTGSSRRMNGKQPDPAPAAPPRLHLVSVNGPALSGPEIEPDELHAWLDGELPAGEAASLGRLLSRRPTLAARAAAYRAQVDELHALYDSVLDEPIPPPLLAAIARQRRVVAERKTATERPVMELCQAAGWRQQALALVGVLLVAAILTGGAVLALPFPPGESTDQVSGVVPSP